MMRKDILPAVTRFELDLKNSLDVDDDLELFDEQSYEFKTVKFIKKKQEAYLQGHRKDRVAAQR